MSDLNESLSSQCRILTIEEVKHDINHVHVGDTVVGFDTLSAVDIFVSKLVAKRLRGQGVNYPDYNRVNLSQRPFLTRDGDRYYGGLDATKLPSKHLMPKKIAGKQFLGKFVNPSVTLLSESLSIDPVTNRNNHSEPKQINVLLNAELHSTGRGIIGRSCKILTVDEAPERGVNGIVPSNVYYTNLEGHNADMAVELLLAESEGTARKLAMDGLLHVFSAGLPGLGKR